MVATRSVPSSLSDFVRSTARRAPVTTRDASFLILSCVFFYLLWVVMYHNGSADAMNAVVEAGKFPDGTPLKTHYTGIAPVDKILSILVAFTYPVTIGNDQAAWLLMVDVVSTLQTGLAWAFIDSVRFGNKSAWLSYPALIYLAVNGFGAAAILPLYFFTHLRNPIAPGEHYLQLWNAKPLAYSIVLGVLLPGLAELGGMRLSGTQWRHQAIIAFFQASPLLAAALQWTMSGLYPIRNIDVRTRKIAYMPSLRQALVVAGGFSAIAHMLVLGFLLTGRESFSAVYVPDNTRPVAATGLAKLLEGSRLFLQYDFLGISLSVALWCYYLVKETGEEVSTKTLTFILGGILTAGPGAVGSATLYWRENRLYEKQKNSMVRVNA
ncbi:uncharacterized protein HMPREF1541_09829 [Cyphellophora europaea CBS 101466]|uniref:Uncharacterized protein n=1 Tax=Cyphellophora europaea (strain CBS 101466) TaxID=1220924 RepID=W2SAN2_CYPE1|nr:uncharacterized protein HMPREF1541_09829 [Cyphellophora europaea CBS 101466]ETN44954.1 hypothetical protein HMPREF1541_09829 [Cyphellophora europaea CBS 101466]